MKMQIFSFKDKASELFISPFIQPSTGAALRLFGDVVKSKEGPMGKHPEDYSLWELGWFDQKEGKFDLSPKPSFVCEGSSFKE